MKTDDISPFIGLERKRVNRCPQEGWYKYEFENENYAITYCVYKGHIKCPYKEPISPEAGAGAYCGYKEVGE